MKKLDVLASLLLNFSLEHTIRKVQEYQEGNETSGARRLLLCADDVNLLSVKHTVYKVFVGKPEGKRQLARPRNRWEGNCKMDLKGTGRGNGDRIFFWLRIGRTDGLWQTR
jgi:hypothetical protein